MRILWNGNGRIGATRQDGAFVQLDSGDVAFCHKVGTSSDRFAWIPLPLPSDFRTQLDVNSTAAMVGARVIGGVVSAARVEGVNAVGWKADRIWSLDQLVELGKLTAEDLKGIRSFYGETVEAAA